MNVVICIKQVPGSTNVLIDEATGVLMRSSSDTRTNPYDLHAIEAGYRLKKQYQAHLTAITMGPPSAGAVLKEAFMLDVDEGFLLTDKRIAGSDCLATAYALSHLVWKTGTPDVIICGKQSTDGDTAQVGPELAAWLQIPYVTNVIEILEADKKSITVLSDMGEHLYTYRLPFPCLIGVDKGSFDLRLPSYKLYQATKDKPYTTVSLDDLPDCEVSYCGLSGSPTRVIRVFQPQHDHPQSTWSGEAEALADRFTELLEEKKFL